jgi:hypothetical protein
VSRGETLSPFARGAWIAAGSMWAVRSAMVFAHPAYMDPVTPFDWFAVCGFSLAFLLSALAIAASPALTPTRTSRVSALVVAGASVVAGIANALEDGFGVEAMFGVFAVSALISLYGPFIVAASLAVGWRNRLAGWWAGVGLGFFTFPIGGSVIVLAMALVLAVRGDWLLAKPAPRDALA